MAKIKIKVKPENHLKIKRVCKWLAMIGYLVVLVVTGNTLVQSHQRAAAIMSNAKIVDAEVHLDGITSERHRHHTSHTYNFSYRFQAGEQDYHGEFSVAESYAEDIISKGSVEVAYNVDQPQLNARSSWARPAADTWTMVKRFLTGIPLFALLAALVYLVIVYGLFVPREDPAQLAAQA